MFKTILNYTLLIVALSLFVFMDECGAGHEDDGAPHTTAGDPGGFTIFGLSKRAHC